MTLLIAAVTGFLAARLLWVLLRPTFAQPELQRPNYRGQPVATAAGVVLPLGLLLVEGGRVVLGGFGVGARGLSPPRLSLVAVAAGMAMAGVLDDLAGDGGLRGLRAHGASLARGRMTTGGAKVLAGVAVALVAVSPVAGGSAVRLLADGALVALAANLANLLDRGPGRVVKAGLVSFLVLALATGGAAVLSGTAVVAGAAAALLLDDLHERLMLGDAGANVLGAVLGMGVVLACATTTRTVALVVLAALNVTGDLVSFSRVIDAVPPLRALDRAGRRHR